MDSAHNVLAGLLKMVASTANGAEYFPFWLLTPPVEWVDPRLASRLIQISV